MSKRGFLNLNDDNFWGNEESKTEVNSEQEDTSESKCVDHFDKGDDMETAEEESQNEEFRSSGKNDRDGWENVRADVMKKTDGKLDIGHPFRHNSPFGGFSRTNAASYYQDEQNGRRAERPAMRRQQDHSQMMRHRTNTFMENGQMETQAELLSRRDFSTLDALNTVYRDKCSFLPNIQRERWTAKRHEDDAEDREAWERERLSSSGSGSSVIEHSGDGPRVGWSSNERTDLNMIDEQYVEYYEYLCQGIQRLFESGITFNADCESRGSSSSFQQPVCRALKSKYYHQYNLGPEIYSRKVFVGGLPIDIEEEELVETFARFGSLVVDWPNKNESKSYYPPKGYVFLIFDHETSVRTLVQHCTVEDEKLFLFISSPLSSEKLKVQIRPWRLADADYLVDVNVPINLRRVVFVGGVPRPIRAVELAHIMDRLYGSVACAGIDTDVEYKYPKGAGRVAFTNYNSYMRAITERYAQLSHGEVEKRVEMKPYVLDDQICEECVREPNGGRHAPFFCPHLECLQYYCESCWTSMHGSPSREHHKPLVKEA
uniref:Cytoplasmic polyadenylation element-binding protein 1 n=1 Tax=Haemonchus contortus TaxID=6289 RepID=A0A7I5E818_HAECO